MSHLKILRNLDDVNKIIDIFNNFSLLGFRKFKTDGFFSNIDEEHAEYLVKDINELLSEMLVENSDLLEKGNK